MIMTAHSKDYYLINQSVHVCYECNILSFIVYMTDWQYWNAACILHEHAASAVNKTFGRCPWHTFALSMATANTIPALAGILPIAPLLPIKWAGRSNPATTFTTSTVSKPTTVTPTSLSSRHQPMLKSTINNHPNLIMGGSNAAHNEKSNLRVFEQTNWVCCNGTTQTVNLEDKLLKDLHLYKLS